MKIESDLDPERASIDSPVFSESEVEQEQKPLIAPLSMSSQDEKKKPISLLPRNFNNRRRLIIAGVCFLFVLIVLQGSSFIGTNYSVVGFVRAF